MPWSCIMISESLKQSYQDQAYGDQWYDVVEGGDRHVVDLVRKRCTFRTWDLTGISCPHAIKALLHVKQEPLPEVYWWYSKEAYMLMYLHKIQLVRGNKSWKVDPSHAMEPPEIHKMVGRPKVKRTRVKNEAMKRRGCGQLQERV
ncbi:hypothetical protein RND71_035661 [Anisodus tanguticus]|uniref:Zinc finger PMZ-type domain-containing protein n=1 Tax=Anisodus tanguticus TaxID=243964 RepID=A0AAE1R4W9_9SOLA|nr:hypothetical protein RND71_035661 [Anisodus tanguticus]